MRTGAPAREALVLRSIVRRPIFSAAATVAVLAGTGLAQVSGSGQQQVAEAAFTAPVTLDADAQAEVDTQAAADAGDEAFESASEVRIQQQRAATEAARVAAEQARLAAEAAAAAEAARVAAAEGASRNAQRDPRGAAQVLVAERGWGSDQFSCLERLWTKESNWRWDADNPSSSAYGIPQALPGSKMSSAGADWETNPVTQIRWGLGYIDARYGTPCSAWGHSQSNNWY